MIDMHYDLLTVAYLSYITGDDSVLKDICKQINNSGVTGIVANLYFMSRDEMRKELHSNYYKDDISVKDMFRISMDIINKYLPNIDILPSIEGCDYIKNEYELEELYKLGLRSIILVWNNKNKYGSGIRDKGGLSSDGIKLIKKAIDLNIGIDLSHASYYTYKDIINIIKDSDKDVVCYASHSNIKRICDRPRNLSDIQLDMLKEVKGYIGIVAYPPFISNNKDVISKYIEMIKYGISYLGDNYIMLSTDDMYLYKYYCKEYYVKSLFDYNNLKDNIYKVLSKELDENVVQKVMVKNANDIFRKLKG